MARRPRTRIVYRSSVTGRFVTKLYALKHKKVTEKQHIRAA